MLFLSLLPIFSLSSSLRCDRSHRFTSFRSFSSARAGWSEPRLNPMGERDMSWRDSSVWPASRSAKGMDRITGWAGFLILSILLSCLSCYHVLPVVLFRLLSRLLFADRAPDSLRRLLRARSPSGFVILPSYNFF